MNAPAPDLANLPSAAPYAGRLLGTIVRLQLQPSCLKSIRAGRKVYDPSPLLTVEQLTLTPFGACAPLPDGSFLLDVHNAAHPSTRNNDGANPLSFVFTSHYAQMQRRFGGHVTLGCAGESILIDGPELVTLPDVVDGIVVETRTGPVELCDVTVAAPCAPFSHFALQDAEAPALELKSALQFLDGGMRGFYCRLAGNSPARIFTGDRVFAVAPARSRGVQTPAKGE